MATLTESRRSALREGGSSVKLSHNFVSLRNSSKNLGQLKSRKAAVKDERNKRRSNILSSLDKFLDDDGNDDQTESTYQQSSFSSGLSSDTNGTKTKPQMPPRREPNIAEEGDDCEPTRQRYRRRGSVTKYSLESVEDTQDSSHHDDGSVCSFSTHNSIQSDSIVARTESSSSPAKSATKKKKKQSRTAAATSKPARPSLLDRVPSERSIDDLPLPMRGCDASVTSIDELPVPMKAVPKRGVGRTSSSNSTGRPPLTNRPSSRRLSAPVVPSNSSFEEKGEKDRLSEKKKTKSTATKKTRKSSGSLAGLSNLPGSKSDEKWDLTHSHHGGVGDDTSVTSAVTEGGTQRYRRRGSVTKYSLDPIDPLRHSHHDALDDDDDHRSCVSEALPPRPTARSTAAKKLVPKKKKSSSTPPQVAYPHADDHLQDDVSVASSVGDDGSHQRYRRRGSVTKYSLESESSGDNLSRSIHQDDRSVVSEGVLHTRQAKPRRNNSSSKSKGSLAGLASLDSVKKSNHAEPGSDPPRQRYKRRGSVTKYSLEES